jgi:hypothetical protein
MGKAKARSAMTAKSQDVCFHARTHGGRLSARLESLSQAGPCHVGRGDTTSDVPGKESGTRNLSPGVRDSGWTREILESDKLAGSMARGIWCAGQPQPVAPHNPVMQQCTGTAGLCTGQHARPTRQHLIKGPVLTRSAIQ